MEAVIGVNDRHGLRARAAGPCVCEATAYAVNVNHLSWKAGAVNAKTIPGIRSAGVRPGHSIRIASCALSDEEAVLALQNRCI